ncbi:heat shock 70 kDa protein 12A-like [Anableps anableps]
MSVYRVEVDSGREKVLLPFKTTVRLPEGVRVTWRHNTCRVVHINDRDLNQLQQHSQYEDRTEMKEKLKSGDFSLILKNPSRGDTGTYSCTVYGGGDILTNKQVLLDVKAGADSFIIAIDFGSGYSGYAFNVKPRGETQIKRWSKELGLDTPKTPTCILFDEYKRFLKFGYEAKTAFINMREEEAEEYYFYENFKRRIIDIS